MKWVCPACGHLNPEHYPLCENSSCNMTKYTAMRMAEGKTKELRAKDVASQEESSSKQK